MNWEHPRNMPNAQHKKKESKSGTSSNFIAAMMLAA